MAPEESARSLPARSTRLILLTCRGRREDSVARLYYLGAQFIKAPTKMGPCPPTGQPAWERRALDFPATPPGDSVAPSMWHHLVFSASLQKAHPPILQPVPGPGILGQHQELTTGTGFLGSWYVLVCFWQNLPILGLWWFVLVQQIQDPHPPTFLEPPRGAHGAVQ